MEITALPYLRPAMVLACSLAAAFSSPVIAGSLDVVPAERVGMSSERLDKLTRQLQQAVDDGTAPGFQVVVARRGQVVLHESIGVADLDSGRPVTDETLYRIYSMTKPVVATAMLVLYEEGKYSLSDPLSKYIPEFTDVKVYAGADDDGKPILAEPGRPPQIRDLFQHTAGLTYGFFSNTPVDKLYLEAEFWKADNLQQAIAALAGMPLLFDPGTAYHYSYASDVQGRLIEVLSGMPVEDFIKSRVLEPLGMDETMTWAAGENAALLSRVHTLDSDGELTVYRDQPDTAIPVDSAYEPPRAFSGGAQLISTADDYWRFAQMLLNGGSLEGERILSPKTAKMMTTSRLPEAVPGRSSGPGTGYGFNLDIVDDETVFNYPVSNGEFSHGGYATTHFWVDPEQELVVVVLNQYLPYSNPQYVDLVHRLVHSAIMN